MNSARFFNEMLRKRGLKNVKPYRKQKMGWFYGFKLHLTCNDKDYIGNDLFSKLFIDDIQLITKLKSNMKGGLRSMYDRREGVS